MNSDCVSVAPANENGENRTSASGEFGSVTNPPFH